MKRLYATAIGVFLGIFLVSAVSAGPVKTSVNPKQPTGLQNAKKAMQARLEWDKKMSEVRKRAHAQRAQALGRK